MHGGQRKIKEVETVDLEEHTGVQQGEEKAGHLCPGPWQVRQECIELTVFSVVMRTPILTFREHLWTDADREAGRWWRSECAKANPSLVKLYFDY